MTLKEQLDEHEQKIKKAAMELWELNSFVQNTDYNKVQSDPTFSGEYAVLIARRNRAEHLLNRLTNDYAYICDDEQNSAVGKLRDAETQSVGHFSRY